VCVCVCMCVCVYIYIYIYIYSVCILQDRKMDEILFTFNYKKILLIYKNVIKHTHICICKRVAINS